MANCSLQIDTMTQRRCTVCNEPALYRCTYCGDFLCKTHLPPEMHWCVGVETYEGDREALDMSSTPSDIRPERKGWRVGTRMPAKSFAGTFSGNYSFALVLLMSISFVLQLLIPGYDERLALIPAFLSSRPETLVTHIFLHGSFDHLFFNMLFFIFFGPVLERRIGSPKFLIIIFFSGIVAGIGWSLTTTNPFVPVVGASGALSGIFATLAVLMPRMRVYLFFIIPIEIWMVLILFAIYDFVMIGSADMIAHTAHLSGLFFGLLAGLSLKRTAPQI